MHNRTFLERILSGERMIADGATGTNLLQRGLPRGVPAERWVLENPDAVIQLHRDFIAAGAQIILTCTFGANPYRLEENNLGEKTIEINHRAVQLARQAIQDRSVWVAGSIGPLGKLLQPYGPITQEEAIAAYAEQAQALANAGVDFLLIETQFDLAEASAAVRGAHSVSRLPVVVSFSYDRGVRTMMGVNPTQMAAEMAKLSVDMVGINCGRSLAENLTALKELRQATPLPIWFKPNAGLPKLNPDGSSTYDLTPKDMAAQVPEWIAAGASVIGGCCGTSPEHLAAIAKAFHRYQTTN